MTHFDIIIFYIQMKANYTFSIIVPLFNNAQTIVATILSVKNQTFKNWECLLINDYSTDDTITIIKRLCSTDRRFKLLDNQRQKGANICRNLGIKHCNAEYLIFLDADDVLANSCLQDRHAMLSNTVTELLISETFFFRTSIETPTGVTKCDTIDPDELICSFIAHKIQWTTTGATWKRQFLMGINGWNEAYPRLQDIELNIRALINKPKIHKTEKADSYYRITPFSFQKQRAALIGFNLLLRNYCHLRYQKQSEQKKNVLYQNAFYTLVSIINNLNCRLNKSIPKKT